MKKRRFLAVLVLSIALHLIFLFLVHFDRPSTPHDVIIFEPIIYSKNGGGSPHTSKKHFEENTSSLKKILKPKKQIDENLYHEHPESNEHFHEHNTNEEGNGNGTGAGSAQGVDTLKAKFLHELRHRLDEIKEYPSLSKELGETGVVEVGFTISLSGEITESHIHKTSGRHRLDQAALKTLSKLKNVQALPPELKIEKLEIIVPLEFDLH